MAAAPCVTNSKNDRKDVIKKPSAHDQMVFKLMRLLGPAIREYAPSLHLNKIRFRFCLFSFAF